MEKNEVRDWMKELRLEKDPPEEFNTLTDEQKQKLCAWIAGEYKHAKTVWKFHTSYGEKHRFEDNKELGFYITNGQFKGAMREMGYEPVRESDKNWEYRIRSQNGRR